MANVDNDRKHKAFRLSAKAIVRSLPIYYSIEPEELIAAIAEDVRAKADQAVVSEESLVKMIKVQTPGEAEALIALTDLWSRGKAGDQSHCDEKRNMRNVSTTAPDVCDINTHLVQKYQHAVGEYSSAVDELSQCMGLCPSAEYDTIYAMSESARDRAIDAKAALDKHAQLHGC